MPAISIVMGSYNHAPYVRAAMDSVLGQTFTDFEFLIADDGSSDETAAIIETYTDPRISFSRNGFNKGACATLNELIAQASGRYIAVMNSDDVWEREKLAYQFDYLEQDIGVAAVFGRASFIDKTGAPIDADTLPFGTIFDQLNRTPGAWLRRFFAEGNCLCHPTILIRRSCYDVCGAYDNRLRQLPDFDMWIRLTKRYAIHVSDRKLIRFRIMPGENTSSPSIANSTRDLNENFLIGLRFFDGIDRERLIEGFGDCLKFSDIGSAEEVAIECALMCLDVDSVRRNRYQIIGLMQLHALLRSAAHESLLRERYCIDDKWFQARMAEVPTFTDTNALQDRIIELEAELKSLRNSSSWRVTSPLRAAARHLRQGVRWLR